MENQPIQEEPKQPRMSDAQAIEASINIWRHIASDTVTVVKIFQEAGFSRPEALNMAIIFLTGKPAQ